MDLQDIPEETLRGDFKGRNFREQENSRNLGN